MTAKTRANLIIIATFIAGIAVGAIGNGAIIRHYLRQMHVRSLGDYFIDDMRLAIKPTPDQQSTIDPIITQRGQEIGALMTRHQNQIMAIMDSLHTQIYPFLTEEQRRNLDNKITTFRKHRLQHIP